VSECVEIHLSSRINVDRLTNRELTQRSQRFETADDLLIRATLIEVPRMTLPLHESRRCNFY
jgi:hypothetical protein